MGIRQGKWQGHLKAAERSGMSLSAYAAKNGINVRRLYEARQVDARKMASIGAVVGAAICGSMAAICWPVHRSALRSDIDDGLADLGDEKIQNCWLDRGRLTTAPGLPHPDDTDPRSHEP